MGGSGDAMIRFHGSGNVKVRNPSVGRSGPPLTAIDKFLWGQKQQNVAKVSHVSSIFDEEFCRFACSGGGASTYSFMWPKYNYTQEANEESLNWTHQISSFKENVQVLGNDHVKLVARRPKKGSPMSLIKGQWTEEEDSKLVKLVKQLGVRKWSQIAEKLEGRAGKQCRERWHNHLRPDIKKDSWSEEEERILVETHAKVGNRWAEIAKCIPGRTENTIKNHWNATKRRQNSRRKNKRPPTSNGKPEPSILQDYIRSKTLIGNSNTNLTKTIINSTNSTTTTPPSSSTNTNDHGNDINTIIPLSSPLIAESYDDELLFMQQLFKENQILNPHKPIVNDEAVEPSTLDYWQTDTKVDHHMSYLDESSLIPRRIHHHNTPIFNYLDSDLYLSHLMNGAASAGSSSSSSPHFCDHHHVIQNNHIMDFQLGGFEDFSVGRRDMDLIELVSCARF